MRSTAHGPGFIVLALLTGQAVSADVRVDQARVFAALAGITIAPEFLPTTSGTSEELARALLDALRFLDPVPVGARVMVTNARDRGMQVNSRFFGFDLSRGVAIRPDLGLILRPELDQADPSRRSRARCILNPPPSSGLIQVRLWVSALLPEAAMRPRLDVQLGGIRIHRDVSATAAQPQCLDLWWFAQHHPPREFKPDPNRPGTAVQDLLLSNRPAAWSEERQKPFGNWHQLQDIKAAVPWLVISGVEARTGVRMDWLSPTDQSELSQAPDGPATVLRLFAASALGRAPTNPEISGLQRSFTTRREAGDGVDQAIRVALLPMVAERLSATVR